MSKISIKQPDIFGMVNSDLKNNENAISSSKSRKKWFPTFNLASGIEYDSVAQDSIVIHRVLQKNCIRDKKNQCLINVFLNESSIKSGRIDASNAARDSLIKYHMNNS